MSEGDTHRHQRQRNCTCSHTTPKVQRKHCKLRNCTRNSLTRLFALVFSSQLLSASLSISLSFVYPSSSSHCLLSVSSPPLLLSVQVRTEGDEVVTYLRDLPEPTEEMSSNQTHVKMALLQHSRENLGVCLNLCPFISVSTYAWLPPLINWSSSLLSLRRAHPFKSNLVALTCLSPSPVSVTFKKPPPKMMDTSLERTLRF